MAWYDKLNEISDTIVKLDQKLGIKKIRKLGLRKQ